MKTIVTTKNILKINPALTPEEVKGITLECEEAHDNCENCATTLQSVVAATLNKRYKQRHANEHRNIVLRPDIAQIEYDYAVVKNQGLLEMEESGKATQEELLEAFTFYTSGVEKIKSISSYNTILLTAEMPNNDPKSDSTSRVVNVIIAGRWPDKLLDMAFMHSSAPGLMNPENTPPRDLHQLWNDDSTFMDGGEKEIIKLLVGETLIRKDSSGYTNVTTRTQ